MPVVIMPATASQSFNIGWDGQCTKNSTVHRQLPVYHNVSRSEGWGQAAESDDSREKKPERRRRETEKTPGKLERNWKRALEAVR